MVDSGTKSFDDGVLPDHENSNSFCGSSSDDLLLDQFVKNATCMHAHACNRPGPDSQHTHTCYHTHTQVFTPAGDGGKEKTERQASKPRKTSGNKEAVRKYREKKKAHTAYLEEEVKKLRALNQQLLGKLRSQALLEAEVLRLKSTLLDLKDRIDIELGVFPFQRSCTGSFKGDCNLQVLGYHSDADRNRDTSRRERICGLVISNCEVNTNGDLADNLENIEVHHEDLIPSSFCGG